MYSHTILYVVCVAVISAAFRETIHVQSYHTL